MTLPAVLCERLIFEAVARRDTLAMCALDDLLEEHGADRLACQTVRACTYCRHWRAICMPVRIGYVLLRSWLRENPIEPAHLIPGIRRSHDMLQGFALTAPLIKAKAMAHIATRWLITGQAPIDFLGAVEVASAATSAEPGKCCSGQSLDKLLGVTPSKEAINYLRCWPRTVIM